MSVTSASNLCFLSGRPLISIWTNVHKVRRLWLVTDIHAYIAEFHADIADVCADIAENLADVRNFHNVRFMSAESLRTFGIRAVQKLLLYKGMILAQRNKKSTDPVPRYAHMLIATKVSNSGCFA